MGRRGRTDVVIYRLEPDDPPYTRLVLWRDLTKPPEVAEVFELDEPVELTVIPIGGVDPVPYYWIDKMFFNSVGHARTVVRNGRTRETTTESYQVAPEELIKLNAMLRIAIEASD
jgi:hypothetical protein